MEHFFRVAELPFSIVFHDDTDGLELVSSLKPFRTSDAGNPAQLVFTLTVDNSLKAIPKEQRTLIREIDTGNGLTIVERTADGGYQFIIKNIQGKNCCLLQANADFSQCRCAISGTDIMRTFGLNNALMMVFAFAGSRHGAILMHASVVRQGEWAYAFTAKSGTGKSTHVNLWLRNIEGCDLLNDDNPAVRIIDGEPYIYGTPWSGKTPCYRNIRARLGAVTLINRSHENAVKRASTIEAFTTLLTACSTMKWDHTVYNNISQTISKIIETTPNFNLYCRPDDEAAIVCHKEISRTQR